MRAAFPLAAALSLCACAMPSARPSAVASPPLADPAPAATGWRALASAQDRARLDRLTATWGAARQTALPRFRTALADAGALVDADAALDHVSLPPGSYDCRLTALGRQLGRRAALTRFPPQFCYVRGEADGALSFTKQTGSDLPGGWLHADGPRRYVFLGARQRTPGTASLGYGVERDRDLAGVIERIAPMRWRLVIPSRDSDAALDIYELTPVPSDRQGAPAQG